MVPSCSWWGGWCGVGARPVGRRKRPQRSSSSQQVAGMGRGGGMGNPVNVGIAVQADWENREFISNISLNVRRLFDFLLRFGQLLSHSHSHSHSISPRATLSLDLHLPTWVSSDLLLPPIRLTWFDAAADCTPRRGKKELPCPAPPELIMSSKHLVQFLRHLMRTIFNLSLGWQLSICRRRYPNSRLIYLYRITLLPAYSLQKPYGLIRSWKYNYKSSDLSQAHCYLPASCPLSIRFRFCMKSL